MVSLSVEGRVALITGGSRGIGAATVKMFCQAGAQVAFNYQKASKEDEEIVRVCGGEARCSAIQQELSSTEQAKEVVDAAISRFGRLDILVANHGIWPPNDAPIDEMSPEQWRQTMAVNLDSVFGLIKHAVAQMRAQNKKEGKKRDSAGHIVLISSTA